MSAQVIVWGSANADVVLDVERVPLAGETLLARAQTKHAGGKGLNQAIAAARAGARTTFCAALGTDTDGDTLTAGAAEAGIDTSHLRRVDAPTGTAYIYVQDDGDNAIVVAPGANAELDSPTPTEGALIAAAAVLVLSLEVPLAGVGQAAAAARSAQPPTTVVLNAAPAAPLPPALLADVDVLVVNEHEAALLARGVRPAAAQDPRGAALVLTELVRAVVVTMGGEGALLASAADGTPGRSLGSTVSVTHVPAPRVSVVDTTAAGDTFTGYLAASLADGASLPEAVTRAVAAGAIAVQRAGAVPSIPFARDVPA